MLGAVVIVDENLAFTSNQERSSRLTIFELLEVNLMVIDGSLSGFLISSITGNNLNTSCSRFS